MKPNPNDYNVLNVIKAIFSSDSKSSLSKLFSRFELMPTEARLQILNSIKEYYCMRNIECNIVYGYDESDPTGVEVISEKFYYKVSNLTSIPIMLQQDAEFRKIK